ncbi:MAG: hypothetical protein HXS44_04735 [Theionarchaea archaeon]|nr:hypothetical protein [Theionarchaea archaeon]
MRKTLVIGLVIVMAVSILSGCIGDEPETTVSVRRVEPSNSGDEKNPVTPQNPPEGNPQNPPPMDLEEPTPEEEEEAVRIVLEDERVQNLIQGSDYKLEVMGCRLLPNNEKTWFLLLELENGEKYTIIINLTSGIVMDIREGKMTERSKGESDNE